MKKPKIKKTIRPANRLREVLNKNEVSAKEIDDELNYLDKSMDEYH